MLFNSYPFLFYFLPLALTGFIVFQGLKKKELAYGWLVLASLIFYGQWELWHLPILLTSVLLNFTIGSFIAKKTPYALFIGITFDLLLLIGFKYSAFLGNTFGIPLQHSAELPLGISFFTFQQIAYLVDIKREKIHTPKFQDYILFVSFFPQLIAGPIVHYREIMPQFKHIVINKIYPNIISLGVIFFSIGLFKKVVLADQFARISEPAFTQAAQLAPLSLLNAWQGMLAYSLQIYFDFSGYAEMAIGLALLFGIWLPINFNSPYKAISIVDFWRRWHITLSNFLRDYVYIPLGGNRVAQWHQALNLFLTMLLAGFWHGAGWNFILWGGLHGLLLVVVHSLPSYTLGRLWRSFSIALTFFLVSLLWILFEASSLAAAQHFFMALWQTPDYSLFIKEENLSTLVWLVAGLVIIWGLPSSINWLNYEQWRNQPAAINLNITHGLFAGVLLFISLKTMANGPANHFIYFVF